MHRSESYRLDNRQRNPRARVYAGEEVSGILVNWLNNKTSDGRSKTAILQLISDLVSLSRAVDSGSPEAKTIYEATIKKLQPYAYRQSIGFVGRARYRTFLPHKSVNPGRGSHGGDRFWECVAADVALQLWQERLIENVRKCAQCGKWMFGRFQHQQFCGESCRNKHHESTPDFKEKRRKYMRDYYRRNLSKVTKVARKKIRG